MAAFKMKKKTAKGKRSIKDGLPATPGKSIPLVNNILVAVLLILLIFKLKDANPGYKWVHESLIGSNLEFIKKNKDLGFPQRQEAKLGFNVSYLNYLNANTPDETIILMPPDTVILPRSGKSDFDKYMKNRIWVSYFIYPRKVVYEREKETSALYDAATHIAIINGWGYHKLPFRVNNKVKHAVIPLNK